MAPPEPNLALAVVARPPVPGRVKSRLAGSLGEERACEVYTTLLRETAASLEQLADADLFMALAPGSDGGGAPEQSGSGLLSGSTDGTDQQPSLAARAALERLGLSNGHDDGWQVLPQRGAHLGERLGNLFEDLFARGNAQAVIVNSDSPGLPVEYLETTRRWLSNDGDEEAHQDEHDRGDGGGSHSAVVFGPTPDGGFYLVAVARETWLQHGPTIRGALASAPLGTSEALADVSGSLEHGGLCPRLLPLWVDVDDESDIALAARLLPEAGRALSGPGRLLPGNGRQRGGRARGEPLTGLREVFLHVTNRCGTHCPHCYARLKDDGAKELTTDEWRRVIDEAANLGARSFVLLGGDPF
ncbi:MAG TPA: DUF2064 domain-containing protein, partial [Thermoleophilia bacterium]|nr:DUF2064 domain-containing protein [Thermoleophilia bacterium]